VELLRALGHDVLTVQDAENADQGIPDKEVLAFAVSQERSILQRIAIKRATTKSNTGLCFRIYFCGGFDRERL
jgi:hypothetical protein